MAQQEGRCLSFACGCFEMPYLPNDRGRCRRDNYAADRGAAACSLVEACFEAAAAWALDEGAEAAVGEDEVDNTAFGTPDDTAATRAGH